MSSSILPSTPQLFKPCIMGKGPRPAKLMIVGEAPGEEEERQGIPFVGTSGAEQHRMMEEAGIDPSQVYFTNVLHTRPPSNQLDRFLVDKKEAKGTSESDALVADVMATPLRQGKYLSPALSAELSRLFSEIQEVQPNLILCLGNTALWALTASPPAISKMRGTVLTGLTGHKLLPTYHPAAVLRQWSLRVIVMADLLKVKRQMEFPEIRKPRRSILIDPTLADIRTWIAQEVTTPPANASSSTPSVSLAVDVETRFGQITEIGFASSAGQAIVIPFIRGFNSNYWPTLSEEHAAVELCASLLEGPCPKILQNGMYDLQYIFRKWGVKVNNFTSDTMLRHHSLYPEMQKGLGFLGSIYTEEPAWKILRTRTKDSAKRDDE